MATAEECFALQEQGYRVELPAPVARHPLTLVRLTEIVGPIARAAGGRAVPELGGAALPGLDVRVRDLFEPDLPPPR